MVEKINTSSTYNSQPYSVSLRPYCIGTLIALILNLILPVEKEGEEIDEVEEPDAKA